MLPAPTLLTGTGVDEGSDNDVYHRHRGKVNSARLAPTPVVAGGSLSFRLG